MKLLLFLGSLVAVFIAHGEGLPVITSQPTNQNVFPSGTATFSVTATGATAYQWRYNGTDILNATNSTLQIVDPQTNSAGYYMVVVKNVTGWVPSKLAYLSTGRRNTDPSIVTLPYSNLGSPNAPAGDSCSIGHAIASGTAQIMAGPELDQMQLLNVTTPVTDGIFDGDGLASLQTVRSGQTVYYRVIITKPCGQQTSTTIKFTADDPSASTYGIQFPLWPEFPEPILQTYPYLPPTNIVKIPGETLYLTNRYLGYTDYGTPTGQWRKDGQSIPGATNFVLISGTFDNWQAVLAITNVQPADAGVYDVKVLGNSWLIGPPTTLSIQTSNFQGVLQSPRLSQTNFVCDLMGIGGRQYALQWSSNFVDWNFLSTISNSTGTVTFTNSLNWDAQFYRAMLLP